MEDRLEFTIKSLKETLLFPEVTRAHGFDERLDVSSFREISSFDQAKISAIDGGSSEIISTPTLAVILNRVYCNAFVGMKKLDFFSKCTFISITRAVTEDDRVHFETKVLQPLEGDCNFNFPTVDSAAPEMMVGRSRGDLSRAISMARRFCEWRYVENALNSGAEFILIDGTLQTSFPGELAVANEVYEKVKRSGAIIAGLSKTTTIFTEEGHPISGFLEYLAKRRGLSKWAIRLGKSKEWAHRALVYFVRLHEGADRGFRLDVFEEAGETDAMKLIHGLVANSRYFASLGYPYALIDAHIYAKVGVEEAMHIKDLILDRLDIESVRRLETVERALSGHRILDEFG
ncbi:MAG: DNA double-strand break repair nuclease NurA [Candidatus Methanomethylicaceae archaeon]